MDIVDLSIEEGSFFAMLGPSGSGKTTCLRLISGFEKPTAGAIRIFGQDVSDIPPNRRNVNTVFQDYALFAHSFRRRFCRLVQRAAPRSVRALGGPQKWSSLRPEALRLSSDATPLGGIVTVLRYLGAGTRVQITAAGGAEIGVLVPTGQPLPQTGETVNPSFDSTALHVMEGDA